MDTPVFLDRLTRVARAHRDPDLIGRCEAARLGDVDAIKACEKEIEYRGLFIPPPDPRLVFVGSGRNRYVFDTCTGWVVKVPVNCEGFHDNAYEASVYRRYRTGANPDGIRYARCRLLPNGWLVMERVERMPISEMPPWAGFVDCSQVGRARDGRVVAYDFGWY